MNDGENLWWNQTVRSPEHASLNRHFLPIANTNRFGAQSKKVTNAFSELLNPYSLVDDVEASNKPLSFFPFLRLVV